MKQTLPIPHGSQWYWISVFQCLYCEQVEYDKEVEYDIEVLYILSSVVCLSRNNTTESDARNFTLSNIFAVLSCLLKANDDNANLTRAN